MTGVVTGSDALVEKAHKLVFTTTTSQDSNCFGDTLQTVSPLHCWFAGQLQAKLRGMPSFVYLHSVPGAQDDSRRPNNPRLDACEARAKPLSWIVTSEEELDTAVRVVMEEIIRA